VILRYLLTLIRGWRIAAVTVILVLTMVGAWLTTLPAVLMGRALDQAIGGQPESFARVQPTLMWLGACVIGMLLAGWLRNWLTNAMAATIEKTEFVGLIRHLLSVDPGLMKQERSGGINTRVHRSVNGLVNLFRLLLMRLLPTVFTMGFAISLAAPRHGGIAMIMLLVIGAGTAVTALQIISQRGIRLSLLTSREHLGAKVIELLWGLDYVRAQGFQELEVAQTDKIAELLRRRVFSHHLWMFTFDMAKQAVERGGFVAVVAVGIWLAIQGQVSKGDVFTFTALYGSLARPLMQLSTLVDESFDTGLQVRELIAMRAMPIDPGLRGTASPVVDHAPVIECRELVVTYRGPRGRHQALGPLSVTIGRGEVVGVAGPSGAGKTTFLSAILGLICHYGGHLHIFGHEARELDKQELARLVAYVPQEPFLWQGTIRENVCYGLRREASDEDILDALVRARLSDLYGRLPEGLDTPLAERGRDLSGGERQRLMLARLFLAKGRLLVLDEATSAIDLDNERLIQEALKERARTAAVTFIVSHRLQSLQTCDRILVIDGGVIVQDGHFDRLSNSSGLFRDLLDKQSLRNQQRH